MELANFVAESLSSIIEGVKAAQQSYPTGSGSAAVNYVDRAPEDAEQPARPTQVAFDIAVTIETERHEEGERRAGVNIKVVEASAGSGRGAKQRNEAASRIQFTVPVCLPVTHSSASHDKVAKIAARRRGGASLLHQHD